MLRQARGYDSDAASAAARTPGGGKLITRQEFAEESDINFMLKKFGVGAQMPAPRKPPEYGDFSEVHDFETAMQRIREAEQTFLTLPADVREDFDNNPAELLTFVHDDANYEEAAEMGLVPKLKAPETPPAGQEPPATAPGEGTPPPGA